MSSALTLVNFVKQYLQVEERPTEATTSSSNIVHLQIDTKMAATTSTSTSISTDKNELPPGRYPPPNNNNHLNPHGLLPGGPDGPKSLEYERSRATFPVENVCVSHLPQERLGLSGGYID